MKPLRSAKVTTFMLHRGALIVLSTGRGKSLLFHMKGMVFTCECRIVFLTLGQFILFSQH